ncbi:MAG: hypothetical protein EOS28_29975 [Mesorhizobium sp.]|nr:MAG: hypothetical protein EOS28_29975 [Mesorhizobium sp.]
MPRHLRIRRPSREAGSCSGREAAIRRAQDIGRLRVKGVNLTKQRFQSARKISNGNGKLKWLAELPDMKESVPRAFSYVQAKKTEFGIARVFDVSDIHVEIVDLLGNRVEADAAAARAGDHSTKKRLPQALRQGITHQFTLCSFPKTPGAI